jgi:zinc transporter ZupT
VQPREDNGSFSRKKIAFFVEGFADTSCIIPTLMIFVLKQYYGGSAMSEESPKQNPASRSGGKMGLGIAMGIAIGVALGSAMDNIGAGIAIGIAIGAGIGTALTTPKQRDK